MWNFWVVLVLMALLATAFVVWPLWRQRRETAVAEATAEEVVREEQVLDLFNEHLRGLSQQREAGELSEEEFAQLKRELELSLLEDMDVVRSKASGGARWPLYAVAVILPLAALVFYQQRGSIEDVAIVAQRDALFAPPVAGQSRDPEVRAAELESLVARLQARVEQQPDNLGNRYLLARMLIQQGEFGASAAEYAHILQREEPSARILAEMAEVIFLAAGNRMTPEVQLLVDRALSLDADDTTALGLAGIGAFGREEYAAAIDYWQRAVARMGPGQAAESLRAGIARARSLQSGDGSDAAGTTATEAQSSDDAGAGASLTVQVSLAGQVQADPGDVVFVYARAWQGPRMPLAIQRLTVADLPATVTLDESMAMAPGMSLTSVPQLEVVVRVSKSGEPVPSSGDWQASVGPLQLEQQSEPLSLRVEQQIP